VNVHNFISHFCRRRKLKFGRGDFPAPEIACPVTQVSPDRSDERSTDYADFVWRSIIAPEQKMVSPSGSAGLILVFGSSGS
jgi:hypothetical protein